MPGRLLAAMALLLILGHVNAQDSGFHSPRFHSVNNIGLLTGSEKGAMQWQTVEGLELHRLSKYNYQFNRLSVKLGSCF